MVLAVDQGSVIGLVTSQGEKKGKVVTPQHTRATKVEEVDKEDDDEPEAELGVDQVINSIHAMTEEEREDFLMKAFAQKDF